MLIGRLFHKYLSKILGLNIESILSYSWYGSNYGGFYLCPDNLNANSIIYSFGLGEDISFDLAVINNFNCQVYGFDPTPKSLQYVEQLGEKKLVIRGIGIGKSQGVLTFYLPKNSDHVSGSLLKNHKLDAKIEVNIDTFDNLVCFYNHTEIDVLKMDIEGTEFEVIPEILNSKVVVKQILIEFHPRFFLDGYLRLYRILKILKSHGYKCFAISSSYNEISFIKV